MTDEEFAALIALGAEQRHVEFKGPGPISDKHLVYRVVRAMLGMTNRRDGGYVIVGVEETGGRLNAVGLEARSISGWTRDSLADKVAPLVDPSIDFDLEHCTYEGRRFVLIRVREFDETPVFCRSNRNDANNRDVVLREGALYVRSRRKPETVEISTAQEMRDPLDLALRKRLRHFVELLQAGGLTSAVPSQATDREKFEAQIADLEF
jgi:predicted HTH transcriptional regulator